MDYLEVANSTALFIIVVIVLAMVAAQAVLFIRTAMKRGYELGMTKESMGKTITNSAVFSVLPSLPIIITLLAMMPALGKYLPWLRLSVIGSAMYESMAADTALTTLGYTGLGDPSVTKEAFLSVVWVMSLGIMIGPVLNTLFLKKYDTTMKGAMKAGGFISVGLGSLFLGFLAVNTVPRLLNFGDPVGQCITAVSGASAVILNYIGKKAKIRVMSEFSFPLALIIGMASAILLTKIFA